MKEFHLDGHTDYCKMHDKYNYCHRIPEKFLFYLNGRFAIINYYKCWNMGDEYEQKIDLLKVLIKNGKFYSQYDISRGWDIEKNLRDYRMKNIDLKKTMLEVNYIYGNICKDFAICTEIPFWDGVCNEEKLKNSYEDAVNYIKENNYNEWYLNCLERLYKFNLYTMQIPEIEIVKTLDHLVKSIKNYTHGHTEKS
jgi:hypothetical protein